MSESLKITSGDGRMQQFCRLFAVGLRYHATAATRSVLWG